MSTSVIVGALDVLAAMLEQSQVQELASLRGL